MLKFLNSALGGALLTYRIQGWKVYIQTENDLTDLDMLSNVEVIARHYLPVTHLTFLRKACRLTLHCSKNRIAGQPSRRRRRTADRSPPPANPAQRPEQSSHTTYTVPRPLPISAEEARLRSGVGEEEEEPVSQGS